MFFAGFLSCESDQVQLGSLDPTVDFILLYAAEGLQVCQLKALSFVKHLWCGVVSDFFFFFFQLMKKYLIVVSVSFPVGCSAL